MRIHPVHPHGKANALRRKIRTINGSDLTAGLIGIVLLSAIVLLWLNHSILWCLVALAVYLYVGIINVTEDWSTLKRSFWKIGGVLLGWPLYTFAEGFRWKRRKKAANS